MYCNKCGKTIQSDAVFCSHCGEKLLIKEQGTKNVFKYKKISSIINAHKKLILFVLVILFFVIYFFGFRCKSFICFLPRNFGGEYCVVHTCERDGCTNKKATDKKYCYTHSPTTSSGIIYTPESAKDVLDFSNIDISHNSSYTVCTGTITNNGRETYTFVEVKGIFKNSYGTIIDTDWTYAVGSEGLAPNESTAFRMSIDKNLDVTNCKIEIIDYDKK